MRASGHDFDQLVGQILGMAGHKADSGNSHFVQLLQKAGETAGRLQVFSVAVHILAQQHDFLHAVLLQ